MKKVKTLQESFDLLLPYIQQINFLEENDFIPELFFIFPIDFEFVEQDDKFIYHKEYDEINKNIFYLTIKIRKDTGYNFIYDDLLKHVYTDIIVYNQNLEKKKKKLQEILDKEREAFNKKIEKIKREILNGKIEDETKINENSKNIENNVNNISELESEFSLHKEVKTIINYPPSPTYIPNEYLKEIIDDEGDGDKMESLL